MKANNTTEKKVTVTVAKGIIGKAITEGYEKQPEHAQLIRDEVKLGTAYFKQGKETQEVGYTTAYSAKHYRAVCKATQPKKGKPDAEEQYGRVLKQVDKLTESKKRKLLAYLTAELG